MINWREIHTIEVILHSKDEYEQYKQIWPDMSEDELLENSEISVDIDTICELNCGENGTATLIRTLDYHQGGGETIEVFETYEEVYEFLTSKSKTLKARLGKKAK